MVQLGDLVGLNPFFLVLLHTLSVSFFVHEVLILVEVISGDLHEFSVNFFIGGFFPGHEAGLKADIVPVSQLHLEPVHGVSIVDHVLFPDLESTVLQITVTEVELPEVVKLRTLSCIVDKAVTTVLKVLLFRDFEKELISDVFKLVLDIVISDGVEDLLEESLNTEALLSLH
jgi:hypothetical protein